MLRTFGCLWFSIMPTDRCDKLQSTATLCSFIGYTIKHKRYWCQDLQTGHISISRHVLFYKQMFPFRRSDCSIDLFNVSITHHFKNFILALLLNLSYNSHNKASYRFCVKRTRPKVREIYKILCRLILPQTIYPHLHITLTRTRSLEVIAPRQDISLEIV